MKKIIFVVLAILVAAGGWVYYTGNKVEEKYCEITQNLARVDGMEVKNLDYKKGLLNSSASYELVFKKELTQKVGLKEPVTLLVQSEIAHASDVKVHSKIFLKDAEFKNFVNMIFGSNLIATTEYNAGLSGSGTSIAKMSDIDFKEGNMSLKFKGFTIKSDLENGHLIKNSNVAIDNMEMAVNEDERLKIKMSNMDYEAKYKSLIDPKEIFEYKFVPYSGEGGFKSINFELDSAETGSINVSLNDSKYVIDTEIKDKLFFAKDRMDIAQIVGNEFKFTNFVAVSEIENLSVAPIEKLLAKYQDIYKDGNLEKTPEFEEFEPDLVEILAANPSFKLKEMSIKNEKGNKLDLNFTLAAKGYDKNLEISQNAKALVFEGAIKLDTMPSEFLYQFPMIAIFEPALLEQGLLQKDGNGVKLEFKFVPEKMDILINNSIFASEI